MEDKKDLENNTEEQNKKGRLEAFFERNPRLNRIKKFFIHPTIWRISAIITASVATVATGGAAIPFAVLGATLATSFISVAAKTFQMRNVEKRRLQKKFIESIGEKDKKLRDMKKTHRKILEHLPQPKRPDKVHKFKLPRDAPSKKKSFYKVLRDVGLENATNVLSIAAGANPFGVAAYVASVAFSVNTIKGEFDERVKYNMEQDTNKRFMNEVCEESGVPAFKNTTALYEHFKEEMIDYESKKRLCEIVGTNTNMTQQDVVSLYDNIKEEVSERIEFDDLPNRVSTTKKLFDTLNPLQENIVRDYDTRTLESIVSYSSPEFKTKSMPQSRNVVSPDPTPTVKRSRDRNIYE